MFFLFAFDGYYPAGGANDFVGVFPTRAEAEAAWDLYHDYAEVVQFVDNKLKPVSDGYRQFGVAVWVEREE